MTTPDQTIQTINQRYFKKMYSNIKLVTKSTITI